MFDLPIFNGREPPSKKQGNLFRDLSGLHRSNRCRLLNFPQIRWQFFVKGRPIWKFLYHGSRMIENVHQRGDLENRSSFDCDSPKTMPDAVRLNHCITEGMRKLE